MQEDMDKIKLKLQEVCQLLEKRKEHVQLKRTQQMVNDQFLETQRLQVMDMRRMQSVLTSEQQRQISGAKKRDERKMELERQMKNIEQKENEDKTDEEFEKIFGQIKSTYDICRKELNEYQTTVAVEKRYIKRELENVQNENDVFTRKAHCQSPTNEK
ncbi:rab GTPase-binding effector protein 1 [Caerostris extrusa]|uniref:Rab GTPase-binding effector protein 1 n=1 Tax=Caerostris extrusa TaxID=172846 RepID=A0AAV4MYH8_CAEEX|nr:rab GTPase-binding effector protein 1 [Caerostris extrusa]